MVKPPGLLSYADVMELLRCSRSTVKRLVAKGLIPEPEEFEGLGPRWWDYDIYAYLYLQKKRPRKSEKD